MYYFETLSIYNSILFKYNNINKYYLMMVLRRLSMRKIKLLGIAPYEGISILLKNVAAKREDIELDTYVGDLMEGVSIAKRYAVDGGYDAIISRGGTSEMLQDLNLLPVVDIPISVYDMFRSIRLADYSQKKYAVVGFPSITKNAFFLKDMLQSNIAVFTVHDVSDTRNTLLQLKEAGYEMLICDAMANSLASQFNLSAILINSGEESISTALDLAVQIVSQRLSISDESLLLHKVIENHPMPAVIYSADGKLLYQSMVSPLPDNINNILHNKLPSILEHSPQKFHYEYSGLIYAITGIKVVLHEITYIVYYLNMRKVPLVLSKNGIRYTNLDQAKNDFHNSFYHITNIAPSYFNSIDQFLESGLPIAVIGQPGTGKDALIKCIYIRSSFSATPMSIIDCAKINEKMWSFLTDNNNSPLSDTKTVIHIKNIHMLNDSFFYELLNLLDTLKLYKRNLLLFTIEKSDSDALDDRTWELINRLHCLSLNTVPLSENLSNLPKIASLYINYLNTLHGKNIIGLEPEAFTLLQNYSWHYNYDQLIRILTELVLSSEVSMITAYAVKQLLKKEKSYYDSNALPDTAPHIDFDGKTLDQITNEIISEVLNQENGNQSRTAKRLGISRSTLWRVLQNNK